MDVRINYEGLSSRGWVAIENAVTCDMLLRLRNGLDQAQKVCREIQVRNGVEDVTSGTVHHIVGIAECFVHVLDSLTIWPVVDRYFVGRYIINSFGGALDAPGNRSYIGRVHRDIRTFSGDVPLMLNVLLMLDDFTLDNGATYLLEGSHLSPDRPDDEQFYVSAARAIGLAGTAVLFNSNMWHAAGTNQTTTPRRALTLTLTPPYFKQQCDYPRLLGYERIDDFSPRVRQLLGYNARTPATLDEWYRPPEKRLYQRDQG